MNDKPLKRNGFIKISFILGYDEGFPVWSKYEGFAKSVRVANWMLDKVSGVNDDSNKPLLCYLIEEVEAGEEMTQIFKEMGYGRKDELFVLGQRLILN